MEKERGAWGALSEEQQQIVAMQSKLEKLEDAQLKVDTKKHKGGRPGKRKKDKKGGKTPKNNEKEDKFAWKNKPPKQGAPTTQKWQNKTYYWCTHHNDPFGQFL